MSRIASWEREPPRRTSRVRVALGVAATLVTALLLTLFALAVWNPWRLVVLDQRFGNPWFGLVLVSLGAFVSLWLLVPVVNETRQRWRLAVRACLGVVFVIGLLGWGIGGVFYRYESTELARSPDGDRAVAVVTTGGMATMELQVWQGSGLLTRQVGSFGEPCHNVRARFAGPNLVVVNQGYGDWEFRLDPETGRPREALGGPHCSTGPVPATLGP